MSAFRVMGITRLIYGRSAMVGLHLLPDAWYEDNRITTWLNTRAVAIDRRRRAVVAVGDVAEYEGTVLGLWPTGVEQAEVAAENAVGGSRRYGGTVPVTMLKILGIDVMSCGRIEVRDDEDELIVREDETARTYMKLIVRDNYLEGAILLGHGLAGTAISTAVKDRHDVSQVLDQL